MSSSDSFKDRLKRTQSNIWKSANKLFGRNVSGGGVEDFVTGGAINADFPGFSKNATAKLYAQAFPGSTTPYKDFQADYKEKVTNGNMTADEFRRLIEQAAQTPAAPASRRTPSPLRGGSPRAPMANLNVGMPLGYQSGSSSGASSPRGRSRGNASPSFMGGFSSPKQAFQGQQGPWSRRSPLRSAADRQKEKEDYAKYKAIRLQEDSTLKPAKIREEYLAAIKVNKKIEIDGKEYPKPPVRNPRGPNAKKSPLKTVIDREYTSAQGRANKMPGDIFIAKSGRKDLEGKNKGEERFKAFMNDVYYNSREYADLMARKEAEAARVKKYNPWQQAIAREYQGPKPRPSFKAFKGAKAGSPERMAYEKLYAQPKQNIRRVWEASPELEQFNQSGRDINRFFGKR